MDKKDNEANVAITNQDLKIKLTEYHSKKYLENLKKTTYKDKKVVFILPNGKEYK